MKGGLKVHPYYLIVKPCTRAPVSNLNLRPLLFFTVLCFYAAIYYRAFLGLSSMKLYTMHTELKESGS